MNRNTLLKKGIESYTEGTIDKILVYPDPQVAGTYAIRTTIGKRVSDWLVCNLPSDATVGVVVDYLEECEFETWPPKSGDLQFF